VMAATAPLAMACPDKTITIVVGVVQRARLTGD